MTRRSPTPTAPSPPWPPPLGSRAQDTAGRVVGAGFVGVPRVYLSSGGIAKAQTLAGVAVQGATSINAVVRAGLAAGTYALLVVNPDGSFGLKTAAFKV